MWEPELSQNVVDDALRDWRRRATELVAVASAIVHFPVLVPLLGGYGPAIAWPAKIAGSVAYLVIVAVAVFRHVDQRTRVWTMLGAIYFLATFGTIWLPSGPYARALPLTPPLLAIGLLGVRSARICTALSAIVLVLAPFLPHALGVNLSFGSASSQTHLPPHQLFWPGVALTADLVVLMVLLERFYDFLMQTVAAQRQAAAERSTAGMKLEREIEERHRLEREIARVGDDERRRLGTEIHDGVCQQLTGALLRCQALELRLKKGTPVVASDLSALSTLLAETIQEARAVAQGICPLEPAPDALAPAVSGLTRRTEGASGIRCDFQVSGDVLVPDPTAAQHMYRITQEALSNAVRHASAKLTQVELCGDGDSLFLTVQDDGVGPPTTVHPDGMGLRTMSFRARILGGELSVGPGVTGGTRVSCRIPRAVCFPVPSRSEA